MKRRAKKRLEEAQAHRYLEIFSQLMKIEQFAVWMKDHIEIHDQVNEKEKTITTLVMYKSCADTAKTNQPEMSEDQNIIKCPACGVPFDANQLDSVSNVQLASVTDLDTELKKRGN